MKFYKLIILFLIQGTAVAQAPWDSLISIASTKVYFDFAQAEVKEEGLDSLRVLLDRAAEPYDNLWIDIIAHTDSIGTHAANVTLAKRRATQVALALADLGWPHDRIRQAGAGKTQPVAPNRSEEGRQANRRAEVYLLRARPMATLTGRALDPLTAEPLKAPLYIEAKNWRDTTMSDEDGYFYYRLPLGEVVRIGINAPGFFPTEKMYRIAEKNVEIEIKAQKLAKGAVADIDNLFFRGNRAILVPESEPVLPRIYEFMRINPSISIEIAGHVNYPNSPPRDTTTFQYLLSLARAKMVHDYLLGQGIPVERMAYKGYSNWEMRFPHAVREEEQAQNRRVEIRVLEMD